MNNLEEAKQKLEEAKKLEEIMGTSQPAAKIPKSRMPRQKDIQVIEELLKEKIKDKEHEIEQKMLKEAQKRWAVEVGGIHAKAANLKQEIEQLSQAVELESKGTVTIDMERYGSYWEKLPKSAATAEEDEEMIKVSDSYGIPAIKEMERKAEAFIINVRIGRDQLPNVQTLIDEINALS